MLRSLYAMSILQHRSTESFRRELQRNPHLMLALGFKLKPSEGSDEEDPHRPYRVPSAAAFSRIRQQLCQLEAQSGVVKAEFFRQREELSEHLPDYCKEIGYDGKAIESHSTREKLPHKRDPKSGEQLTSDPDASWGCHKQYSTDANGKEKVTKKCWFGYKAHVLADVNYELPIDFKLTPANESEHPHCNALVDQFLDSPLLARCDSFVADRGLDNDVLRAKLYRKGVLPVIDTRNLWQEKNLDPDQLQVPTRSLDESVCDSILRTECGGLYCKCPQSGEIRPMSYQGRESQRGTLKWACPAATYGFNCEGQEQCYGDASVSADAKSRVVRTKVKVEHLRQYPPLPPCSDKWKRKYRKRSGLERLNSRLADGCMLHSHYLRGQGNMGLKIIISMTVMLAAANVAIKSQRPEQVRSLIKALAA